MPGSIEDLVLERILPQGIMCLQDAMSYASRFGLEELCVDHFFHLVLDWGLFVTLKGLSDLLGSSQRHCGGITLHVSVQLGDLFLKNQRQVVYPLALFSRGRRRLGIYGFVVSQERQRASQTFLPFFWLHILS